MKALSALEQRIVAMEVVQDKVVDSVSNTRPAWHQERALLASRGFKVQPEGDGSLFGGHEAGAGGRVYFGRGIMA